MTEFYYEAYLKDGSVVRDRITASDEGVAHSALSGSGKTPFVLVASAGKKSSRDRSRFLGKLPVRFSRHDITKLLPDLSVLLRSGLTIDQSIALLVDETSAQPDRNAAARVLELLREGKSVSGAFSGVGISDDIRALISAGEASGRLVDVLDSICHASEEKARRRAEMIEALLYPAFLVAVMLFSVGILTFFLVPAIEPIFAASQVAKPTLIAVLGGVREFLTGCFAIPILGTVGLLALLAILPSSRQSIRMLMYRLPGTGRFLIEANVADYMRTLSILMDNGVPARDAMKLSASTGRAGNIRSLLAQAEQNVRSGASIHEAFGKTELFTRSAVAQIRIGEEANRLPAMLMRCAVSIEQRQKRRIDRAMTFLTPAITIGLGALVGTLVISVMSALLSINEIVVR